MTDYAVSTNLISWVPAMHGIFGWPSDLQEAELVRQMRRGDVIVPKFAQHPVYNDQESYQREICEFLGDDFETRRAEYEQTIRWGAAAVPFVLVVSADPPKRVLDWECVAVSPLRLEHPISTSEFLRLRAIPLELAGQFKGMAAPGRRIQRLPFASSAGVIEAGHVRHRGVVELRTETTVRAETADEAQALLAGHGLQVRAGDRAFLFDAPGMAGLHVCRHDGELIRQGQPIAVAPAQLLPLLRDAAAKARRSDYFTPARAYKAAEHLVWQLDAGSPVEHVAEFAHFHDRFVLLDSKVTHAIEISRRPPAEDAAMPAAPAPDAPDDADEGEDPELSELDRLLGLTVEAVEELLAPIALPRSVLAEAVTAIRSGKHLLLSGPPGTGKSTLAIALARAVVGGSFRVVTATADWTSFDTIGGYLPQSDTTLAFEPGSVLRCLETGEWLVIDELNRADIDKAFGPLFTLLASDSSYEQANVTLPYRQGGKDVDVGWAPTRSTKTTRYAVTPAWRIVGTMNAADKASLFQLSFAFLRRFAVVEVPLPGEREYRALLEAEFAQLPMADRERLVRAAMAVAHGKVPLGPAILRDVATFTERGVITTTTGSAPYDDADDAFLAAVRLYAAPQYEGAPASAVGNLLGELRELLPDAAEKPAWNALERALDGIALAGA